MKNQDLERILEKFNKRSETVSTLTRSLAFAGIGVIWIMSNQKLAEIVFYWLPLAFFVAGLLADVLQYLWQTVTLFILYNRKENDYLEGRLKDDERVLIPNYIALGGWVFFALKVLFALTGFVMVFVNLLMLF